MPKYNWTTRERWFLAILVILALAFVGYSIFRPKAERIPSSTLTGEPQTRGDSIRARADCPDHRGVFIPLPNGDSATVQELSLPGPKTLIPEFHDCQRLIEENGVIYGALVGIFAHQNVDQFVVTPARFANSVGLVAPGAPDAAGGVTTTGSSPLVAFVEAVAWGDYPRLGIIQGFNCLYIVPDATRPTGLGATMVHVQDEKDCDLGVNVVQGIETPLFVYPLFTEADFTVADFPGAARWDWDRRNQWWVIGVKCGASWCIVGPEHSQIAPLHDPPTTQVGPQQKRVFRIRGWYDEQRLAVETSTGLFPGPQIGTAFPAHDLGRYSSVDEFSDWKLVANVELRQHSTAYKSKLGFEQSVPRGPYNEVGLCQGTGCNIPVTTPPLNCKADDDGNTWYARITPPGGVPTYRCVNHHAHKNYDPPATVRWRWSLKDETLWTRCAQGCCQVTGPS